jgi:starvation-inducible DNA-binding protein
METITYKNQVKKPFKKLGFSYLDTAEIVVSLRQLLIEYQIHYQKLRIYHWNVQGPEFFELHNEFENEYTKVQEQIDIIAERIRVFGQNPAISLTETIKNAKIQENVEAMNAKSMVLDILKDFGILHGTMLDVLDASFNIGDIATEKIITDFIQELEKRNWMFSSWLK